MSELMPSERDKNASVFLGEESCVNVDDVGPLAWVAILFLVVILTWHTGIATDDYVFLLQGLTQSVADNWWPTGYISIPVLHYTNALAYFAIGDRPWAYDLLKALYVSAGIFAASRFFGLFCAPRRALALGFFFIFLPLHDAIPYSVTNLYLVISFGCYLYAYVLGARGWLGGAVLFALLGSFSSYGSPPIALGLALLALLSGQRKLIGALLIPNLLYIAYYLITSTVLKIGTQRLTGDVGIIALAKQMFFQVATFFDAAIGPSAWAKLYYSIASLNLIGLLIGLTASFLLLVYLAAERRQVADRRLPVSALVILFSSFGMFALTGHYPQLAFSLGDRVMIYGGFFLVCLVASIRLPRVVDGAIAVVLMLAIAGISTHWKEWRRDVDQVAVNIQANQAIHALPLGALLFVSGHQYSRLGPYAHIDFFTADYVVQTFFKLKWDGSNALRIYSFNRRLVYEDEELRDRKYGSVIPVQGGIWLYDSQRNVLDHVEGDNIQKRLDALPEEIRNWTQQVNNEFFRSLILKIAPSLSYAYRPQ